MRVVVQHLQKLATLDPIDMVRMHQQSTRNLTHLSNKRRMITSTSLTKKDKETKDGGCCKVALSTTPSVLISYLDETLDELKAKRANVLQDISKKAGGAAYVHVLVCKWKQLFSKSWYRHIICIGKPIPNIGSESENLAQKKKLNEGVLSFVVSSLKLIANEEPIMTPQTGEALSPKETGMDKIFILVQNSQTPQGDCDIERHLFEVLDTYVPILGGGSIVV